MDMDRPIGWTTLEESKELRELGIDKGTNDLWYCKSYLPDYSLHKPMKNEKIISPLRITRSDIPAWSLGALIATLPPWVVVYDKAGVCHDAFLKGMDGAVWYEYWDYEVEECVKIWQIVEGLTITAVIRMVKFMLSHPDILETRTAHL